MIADTSTAVATYAIDKATGTLRLSSDPVVVAPNLSAVGITPVIVGQ